MRAVREDTDYYIFLKEEEIRRLCNKEPAPWGLKYYPHLYAQVVDSSKNKIIDEIAALCCTRDAFTLHNKKAHDNIYFEYEKEESGKEGPTIKVFTPVLAALLNKEFLVTRYNCEAKLWIYREN
jgi:hypothetical protein